ncbi:LCP family protein [Frigoribacterium sp. 2-23]|uniref:LCP family protein n=1 Tax=Frigoribacterium sp. 2-23 TaxID=3415006 RepID=UPI003C6FAD66
MPEIRVRRRRRRSFYRRHRPLVLGLTSIAALLAIGVITIGVYAASLFGTVDGNLARLDDAAPSYAGRPAASSDGAMNILLLGSDSRRAADERDLREAGDQRADTIMLLHVPADRRDVQVMSILRDTWVDVPGHGPAKVNAALAHGGVALMMQTVEQLVDARIDHVAVIDFAGLSSMVDSLGAVQVHNTVPFSRGDRSFESGSITLRGDDALAYVRERYAFADGDFQRARNQQALLKAIGMALLSTDTLSDPPRVSAFVENTARSVSVDSAWSVTDMVGLGVSLRSLRPSGMTFFTMPTNGTGTSPDGQSIVVLDDVALPELRAAFAKDTVEAMAGPR